MAKHCEVCGKKTLKSAKLTFSHKQLVNRQTPNLQTVRVNDNGVTRKMTVCAACLKDNKVQKAV